MADRPEDWRVRELREWEKGTRKMDLQKEFRDNNQGLLKNFGRDRFTYKAETTDAAHIYWYQNEVKHAHGYPYTAWLQTGLVYAVGVYTAREQGCIPSSQFMCRFWRFHYFDWLTFLRRAGIYGWAGGLVAGTILFGSPDLSMKRAIGWYNYWFAENHQDRRGDYSNLLIGKF